MVFSHCYCSIKQKKFTTKQSEPTKKPPTLKVKWTFSTNESFYKCHKKMYCGSLHCVHNKSSLDIWLCLYNRNKLSIWASSIIFIKSQKMLLLKCNLIYLIIITIWSDGLQRMWENEHKLVFMNLKICWRHFVWHFSFDLGKFEDIFSETCQWLFENWYVLLSINHWETYRYLWKYVGCKIILLNELFL